MASFDLIQGYRVPTLDDWRDVPGLEVRPPNARDQFRSGLYDTVQRLPQVEGGADAPSDPVDGGMTSSGCPACPVLPIILSFAVSPPHPLERDAAGFVDDRAVHHPLHGRGRAVV